MNSTIIGTDFSNPSNIQLAINYPPQEPVCLNTSGSIFATIVSMIAVVQRVLSAGVFVEEPAHAETIESGLCVLLGIEEGDTQNDGDWMAKKLVNLRIFNDEHEKMNRSLLDISGELLLVSQFTLAGDCSQGHRPSFIRAARPEVAKPLVEYVGQVIRSIGVPVKEGVFGAKMRVEIENDGPVTILLQRD